MRALQARALPLGHVVNRAIALVSRVARAHAMGPGSVSEPGPPLRLVSTPHRDRTCRFPLWRRAFLHWNLRRTLRRDGVEPPMTQRVARVTAGCIAALPPTPVSVEGFEPSTSCARGIPARRDCQTAPHAVLLPEGIEPIILRLKAGHPGHWTTGAARLPIADLRLPIWRRAAEAFCSFGNRQSAFGNLNTHGWIRTTSDAVNSRALYRLSYVGQAICDCRFAIEELAASSLPFNRKSQIANRKSTLSRVGSNHEPPGPKPGVLPVELRLKKASHHPPKMMASAFNPETPRAASREPGSRCS